MSLSRHHPPRRPPVLVVVAASALVALAFALLSVTTVSVLPLKLERRQLQVAGATMHVLVDLPRSRISDRKASWPDFDALTARADLLAHVMDSAPVIEHIGQRAGVAPDRIAVVAPVTASVQSILTEPGSEQRARELVLSADRYRLELLARPARPIIDIYAQAPSRVEAERLASASIAGLRDYLRDFAIDQGVDPDQQVKLQQLGRVRAAVINGGTDLKIAALTFLIAFALSCVALLVLIRLRCGPAPAATAVDERGSRGFVRRGAVTLSATRSPGTLLRVPQLVPAPSLAGAVRPQALRVTPGLQRLATRGGDWPRTTRVLPWMLASFLAILWLVPFDSIQLNVSLPIDLKFDRLVLPFIVVTWVVSMVVGGRGAPRLRLTWIHGAVGAFVALAWLSVVLGAGSLNQTLELDDPVKKLPLLIAYLALFAMLTSVVRRNEVKPFLTYTLMLAVICAVGMIVEYRMIYNVFFDLSDKLLPGIFQVTPIDSGYDLGGRRTTHGPAMHGLVAVAMLSMALPIALVGVIHEPRWRRRVLYGLAACLLLTAMLATQRKTALLAPVSVVLTLAYFRRRELLKLAPLAVALLIAVQIVSPSLIGSTARQFKPDQLGANTVSDRSSDYDAVRPDVWTHLAFGRGYGSYQPVGHRILDSELLVRIVEMGVLGLIAFVLMGVSVVATARALINSRHPTRGPAALAGAAAAVVFLVVSSLFDAMSFAQVPYIFLSFAALVAVAVKPPDEAPGTD